MWKAEEIDWVGALTGVEAVQAVSPRSVRDKNNISLTSVMSVCPCSRFTQLAEGKGQPSVDDGVGQTLRFLGKKETK